MKKLGMIAGVILLVIILGIFGISTAEQTADATVKQTKVGLILNGSSSDNSWGQSHYEGLQECSDSLNLEILCRENVPEDESSKAVMEELIGQGCEIIICDSFGYGEWEIQVAEAYPEIFFFHATGVEERKNLATYFGRIYQMRYLSGIVAGLQTQTDEIGYVAAFPISEVNRGINAFTLGVQAVNPDAVVHVVFSNSWTEDEPNKTAAEALIDKYGIDVLTMHTNSDKPLEVAEKRGIWSIGYNVDTGDSYPGSYLTAPVWEWKNFYEPHILECLQGKFIGKHYWEGVETGLVSLAPLTGNVKSGIADAVEKEKERLQSGTFDVFYGPIVDNKGNLRVAEGESMPDELMLNEFDWYVKGVVLDEEDK